MRRRAQRVGEQDREGAFVHLDAVPVGGAVEPGVLRPVAVGLLDGAQIGEDRQRVVGGAGGEEAARGLDQVARPDQMVAAEVVVALAEAPGDRQAGDRRARERRAAGARPARRC